MARKTKDFPVHADYTIKQRLLGRRQVIAVTAKGALNTTAHQGDEGRT